MIAANPPVIRMPKIQTRKVLIGIWGSSVLGTVARTSLRPEIMGTSSSSSSPSLLAPASLMAPASASVMASVTGLYACWLCAQSSSNDSVSVSTTVLRYASERQVMSTLGGDLLVADLGKDRSSSSYHCPSEALVVVSVERSALDVHVELPCGIWSYAGSVFASASCDMSGTPTSAPGIPCADRLELRP